ncbi:hypothetical protein PGT21_019441 [Puccinia graminis f. sp. tritici]|uniref:Uncharacterized protein n=1 Tax=Puccinia graminis f. sp. tritici TaxID=56615 RepID=A0A5B0M6B8_PUCGR|nr:hypothetical protein PGT21_019441 [Puccinia graminis f. sp. tritici]
MSINSILMGDSGSTNNSGSTDDGRPTDDNGSTEDSRPTDNSRSMNSSGSMNDNGSTDDSRLMDNSGSKDNSGLMDSIRPAEVVSKLEETLDQDNKQKEAGSMENLGEREDYVAGTLTITSDYIDDGYPQKEFMRRFPENRGSTAEGDWKELPGYPTGCIGFIMLLDHDRTEGYLKNDNIWPETWWIVSEDRYHMYLGNITGVYLVEEQKIRHSGRKRRKEEEKFLAELVSKMVGLFGKIDWNAFKWVLRDEQACRGTDYKTFWKDWEYAAIAD